MPKEIVELVHRWKELNSSWQYRYFDDKMCEDFISSEYEDEWVELYLGLPLGAMRADLWRYLAIFRYGGVYADIDTFCEVPLDNWVNKDFGIIVSAQDIVHFSQWIFAAKSNHPFLGEVILQVKRRLESPDYNSPDFVDRLTGVEVWTDSIKNGIGCNRKQRINIIENIDYYNRLKSAREHKFLCLPSMVGLVKHLYASQNWKYDGYVSWTKAKEKVRK
ncbi:MAG: hypothetical protein HQK96_16745 [Nitrospirae bacterium]|nr:hypothetical protein [Nitrospirota bacterium]